MKSSYLAISLTALFASQVAKAGADFYLQLPVQIEAHALIPEPIRKQCGVDMLLGNYLLSEIGQRSGSVQRIEKPEEADGGKLVQVTILYVEGFGGGGWSGPKAMTIRADAKGRAGSVVTKVFTRSSRRGALLNGFSGTCGILDHVAEVLGKDVAVWLARTSAAQKAGAPASAASAAETASEGDSAGKE